MARSGQFNIENEQENNNNNNNNYQFLTRELRTCARASCRYDVEANDNLKIIFFFILVSTSGASDWQACKDSH